MEAINVATSAIGTTSQIPVTPNRRGNVTIPITKKIKVLKEETNAEINPLDNAVNNPEVKILNPQIRKERRYRKTVSAVRMELCQGNER